MDKQTAVVIRRVSNGYAVINSREGGPYAFEIIAVAQDMPTLQQWLAENMVNPDGSGMLTAPEVSNA